MTGMGVAETAWVLGVSISAVRKAIVRETLKAELVRGEYRVLPSEADRYRQAHLRDRRGVVTYEAIAVELADPGTSLEDLDSEDVAIALEYAKRRRRRWPPRVTA